jgi:hypothetical protein
MDYRKIYNKIVERGKSRTMVGYYEKHHIIPKCVGGKDVKDNIVNLTSREHFICHWLLHNMFPDNVKLSRAFTMMCLVKSNNQYRYTPSSRIIEYSKLEHSRNNSGENNPRFWEGKKRDSLSGENHPMKKYPELRNQISIKLKGHLVSEETRKKISEKNKNKIPWNKNKKIQPLSESHKIKISNSTLGKSKRPKTNEEKEKISKYQRENSSSAKKIVQKDKDGNVINIFNTVKDARRQTGVSRIFDGLKKRKEYVNGYKWEYYDL